MLEFSCLACLNMSRTSSGNELWHTKHPCELAPFGALQSVHVFCLLLSGILVVGCWWYSFKKLWGVVLLNVKYNWVLQMKVHKLAYLKFPFFLSPLPWERATHQFAWFFFLHAPKCIAIMYECWYGNWCVLIMFCWYLLPVFSIKRRFLQKKIELRKKKSSLYTNDPRRCTS